MRAVSRGHEDVQRVKMKSTTLTWPSIDAVGERRAPLVDELERRARARRTRAAAAGDAGA